MKLVYKFLFVMFLMPFISCVNEKEELISEIKILEDVIRKQNDYNSNNKEINVLLTSYLEYCDKYPEDTNVVTKMLYNAASLSITLNNSHKAIELLNLLITKYPNSEIIPEAYIYLGFIYETILNDKNRARVFYEKYLNKFPEHELREDIIINLKNIDKTPEEIVESFMENNENKKNDE